MYITCQRPPCTPFAYYSFHFIIDMITIIIIIVMSTIRLPVWPFGAFYFLSLAYHRRPLFSLPGALATFLLFFLLLQVSR
uniref:Uncharacterized protein n=1 Tax=Anopheles albimanus TaxID=7167 RepID=A0A182FZ82_ANOAL